MNDEAARQGRPASNEITGAESTNTGGERPLTPLQSVIAETGDALGLTEKLSGRARAVAIDIARRQLARLMRRNRPLLEEWNLWPEEEASIAVVFTRGFVRIRARGSDADLQELKRWLVSNDEAFADLQTAVRIVRGEQ